MTRSRATAAAILALLVLVVAGATMAWVRTTLTSDAVRTSLASQVSRALGQPVSIGAISLVIRPRLALSLGEVRVGDTAQIAITRIDVGAALRALVSRRIQDASVHVSGARVSLPLPAFALGGPAPGAERLRIVSVKEILVRDLVIIGGDQTLTGEVDVVPDGSSLTIRRISLAGDGTSLEIAGRITDLAGPTGELSVRAGSLSLLDLAALAGAFRSTPTPDKAASASAMSLAIELHADRVLVGPLALDTLSGQVRLTPEGLTLEPVSFAVLGGRGAGSMVLSRGEAPAYRLKASFDDLDVAAAAAAAGRPDAITGRLAATVDVEGQGTSAQVALRTARGTARAEARDGTVRGLEFLQTLTAMTTRRASAGRGPVAAPDGYSRIGLSMDIAGGIARTDDFRFESSAVQLTAAGTVALDGGAMDLAGRAQLANGMSAPARVTGPVTSPRVQLDGADAAMRALGNLGGEGGVRGLLDSLKGLLPRGQ